MTVWAWVQPVDRVWKVITDHAEGSIKVYDEKNDIVMEQKDLSRDAISMIEENFLGIVATRLINNDQKSVNDVDNKRVNDIKNKKVAEYNPMYA